MNSINVSLVSSALIVLLCTWAVLTHKVRTNSLEIFAIALVCIAAAIGVGEAVEGKLCTSASELILRVGLALAGVLYFIRVEIFPRIFKPIL